MACVYMHRCFTLKKQTWLSYKLNLKSRILDKEPKPRICCLRINPDFVHKGSVRGDISRETNGPNIRAMVSLGTFSVWQRTERSVEVNEEIMWINISQI